MVSLKRIGIGLSLAMLIIGMFSYHNENETKKISQQAKRKEEKRAKLSTMTVKEKTYFTTMGTVQVLDIPVSATYSQEIIEIKRCIVWKDYGGQSSMSCEGNSEIPLD